MDLGDRGIYCVAYGDPARECARELIRSVHKNTELPICLVGNRRVDGADQFVYRQQHHQGGRWAKTRIWWLAPQEWQYVLYMDADMLVRGRVDIFFQALEDGWDMVMTQSPPRCPTIRDGCRIRYEEENTYSSQLLGGDSWLQLAGGIWSFHRNQRTEAFLKSLHEEWKIFRDRDQQAMNRAWFEHRPRTWLLPWHFNWFAHLEPPAQSASVLHFATAAREWTVNHPGRKLWKQWVARI